MENNILRLIKKKLFEPRKRVVNDVYGSKIVENAPEGATVTGLSEKDIEIFGDVDGWNVADRDYVDYKIALALSNKTKAPAPLPPIVQKEVIAPVNKSSSTIFESSKFENNECFFFKPGFTLYKLDKLEKMTIMFGGQDVFDCSIIMKSTTGKILVQSEVKSTPGTALTSEVNYSVDADTTVFFEIKASDKKKNNLDIKSPISLQVKIVS